MILTLFPVAFMYSYFDGKLNTEDCPVMNMQIKLKSKLFKGFPFPRTKKTHENSNKVKIRTIRSFSYSEHKNTNKVEIKTI